MPELVLARLDSSIVPEEETKESLDPKVTNIHQSLKNINLQEEEKKEEEEVEKVPDEQEAKVEEKKEGKIDLRAAMVI